MVRADVAQEKEARAERAILTEDADECRRANDDPILSGTEQSRDDHEVGSLSEERQSLTT